MNTAFAHISLPFDFSWLQQVVVVNGAITRLLAASLLGGIIGLEREVKRRRRVSEPTCLFAWALPSSRFSPLYWPAKAAQ